MSGGRHALAVGLLLLIAGAGVAVAQPPPSLQAAMLGATDGVAWTVPSTSPAPPLFSFSADPHADTTRHDPWIGRDKALHAGGSFLLTLSGQYVLTAKLSAPEGTALPIAAGTTLALGLAKEVMDSRRTVRPHFSTRDLLADAVGVALAVGLILL